MKYKNFEEYKEAIRLGKVSDSEVYSEIVCIIQSEQTTPKEEFEFLMSRVDITESNDYLLFIALFYRQLDKAMWLIEMGSCTKKFYSVDWSNIYNSIIYTKK